MAKKSKKKSSEEATDTSTGETQTAPPAVQLPLPGAAEEAKPIWREVTDTRHLKVNFSDKEHESNVHELARSVNDLEILENSKKAAVQSYGHKIKTLEARQGELSGFITNGFDLQHVKCRWYFECVSMGDDKQPIFHPEYKVLVRLDTMEVVETARISGADYSMYQELPLKTEPVTVAAEKPEGEKTPENVVPIDGAPEGGLPPAHEEGETSIEEAQEPIQY